MILRNYIRHPIKSCTYALRDRNLLNWIPDKCYLKLFFWAATGKRLNLHNPKTFNEKLQWLKLYYHKPEFTAMVDKYEVKKYVAEKIGERYVIPSIGIWDSFEEIPFEKLPNQFVIKSTHDSGGVIVCRNKSELNLERARERIRKSLKKNYFYSGREWPYKNVKPRVLVEQYMKDDNYVVLPVFKVLNFSGQPKLIQVILNDKTADETVDYYSTEWKKLNIRQNFPNSSVILPRPEKLDEILSLAQKLSFGFPHIRTDFYVINNEVYFSEFTFYSDSGIENFVPDSWDTILGEWIELPQR